MSSPEHEGLRSPGVLPSSEIRRRLDELAELTNGVMRAMAAREICRHRFLPPGRPHQRCCYCGAPPGFEWGRK